MTMTTALPLPRPQDSTCGRGVNPVESEPARLALVEAYKALRVLDEGGLLDFIEEKSGDPMAAAQARDAIVAIEDSMSPNLLVTVLPSYSKVRFATDRSRSGEVAEGIVRDGAWGLYPDRSGSTERRITTNGWEFFVTPETVFTFFEVDERG
jgi:hypothetical protein